MKRGTSRSRQLSDKQSSNGSYVLSEKLGYKAKLACKTQDHSMLFVQKRREQKRRCGKCDENCKLAKRKLDERGKNWVVGSKKSGNEP